MNSLIELKVYLINKYLNKDYRLDDTTVKTVNGEKTEYFYINNLLFRSIENSLKVYEPLLLLGTTKDIEDTLNHFKRVVKEWNKNEKKYQDKETNIFIKDYSVDINEIDNLVLNLINDSLKGKLWK